MIERVIKKNLQELLVNSTQNIANASFIDFNSMEMSNSWSKSSELVACSECQSQVSVTQKYYFVGTTKPLEIKIIWTTQIPSTFPLLISSIMQNRKCPFLPPLFYSHRRAPLSPFEGANSWKILK